jgi:hypothetical protein
VQCQKCGQKNLNGAQCCQGCGTPLGEAGIPLVSAWSRILGVFVLIAGVLALVGIFLSWFKISLNFGEFFGSISASASGWDLVTGGGGLKGGAETYAIITFIGSIVVLVGAVWALATPRMKAAWAVAIAGGVLAIVGSAWGWNDLPGSFSIGDDTLGASMGYGAGLYLAMMGGIAGLIAGIVGIRR